MVNWEQMGYAVIALFAGAIGVGFWWENRSERRGVVKEAEKLLQN